MTFPSSAVPTDGAAVPITTLDTLATEINAEHDAAERTARTAIVHAKVAGDHLLQAKAQVAHGQWLPWLSANCPALADRTARAYMRLARNWGTLETKTADSANLSIDAALKLLNVDSAPITGDLLLADNFLDAIAESVVFTKAGDATAESVKNTPSVSAATVAAMLAELPQADQRVVLDTAAAAGALKVVRADAKYLHTSQKRHEWYTPVEYIEAARDVMGGIDLDPASCEVAQGTVQAARFYSKEQDGLVQPWHGRVWLNPPFEAAVIAPFVAKLLADYQAGAVQQAIVLTDSATDTHWFHELANTARIVCFTKGRITFTSPLTDSQAPQRGQAFTYLGNRPEAFAARFRDFGLVVEVQA